MFSGVFKQLGLEASGAMGTFGMLNAAAVGLGAAVTAIAGISIKSASEFDQQMARIAGLTDTTSQQFDYYKQQLLELSPQLDLSAADAAKA